MSDSILSAPPFNLSPEDIAWVRKARASLDDAAAVAQLFNLMSFGDPTAQTALLARLQPGGITRFFGPDAAQEMAFLDAVRAGSAIPPLVSADLEGSRMSLAFGTEVPNPLALAAVDDVAATREISRIMAAEAAAMGVNWSLTPVLDINAAWRSPIVATRGFGADPERIRRHALEQIGVFQQHGIAATAKHWPGEGHDDRDQHLVTTINPLNMDQWEATHGMLYRAAINAGVLSVMSAHIALPAFVRSLDPDAGREAFRPASLNPLLNFELLRKRLGFNGLIVSDASEMAGLGSWRAVDGSKPELLAAGCDMILFSHDPEADMADVAAALRDGRLSRERFEDALLRVLGLKAALGLHRRKLEAVEQRLAAIGNAADRASARAIAARAPTLEKDVIGLLPLDPARHRRVLVFSGGIVSPLHFKPMDFILPELLRAEGFDVTIHEPGKDVTATDFDLVLYLFGEETLLTRGRIFLDWLRLTGSFVGAMKRHWHDVPCLQISFGYPYYLYDAPRMPVSVNAWCTMDSMQEAVVDCLLGRKEWNRTSPVDAFCGLEDARF